MTMRGYGILARWAVAAALLALAGCAAYPAGYAGGYSGYYGAPYFGPSYYDAAPYYPGWYGWGAGLALYGGGYPRWHNHGWHHFAGHPHGFGGHPFAGGHFAGHPGGFHGIGGGHGGFARAVGHAAHAVEGPRG